MAYALEEGPCRGVMDSRLLPAYLNAAKRFPLNRERIQSIRDWSREIALEEIAALADRLLREQSREEAP